MRPIFDIFSLGDHSITLQTSTFSDIAANRKIAAIANYLKIQSITGILDIIPAFNSLTIIYDVYQIRKTGVKSAKNWIESIVFEAWDRAEPLSKKDLPIRQIPVCYEEPYCLDRKLLERSMTMNWNEIVALHTSKVYQVCMVGYLPAFPTIGILPESFELVKKETRRQAIPKGSVGIMGRQTGIFPMTASRFQLATSGIWSIIGKSVIELVDFNNSNSFFNVGDQVQFKSITYSELNSYKD